MCCRSLSSVHCWHDITHSDRTRIKAATKHYETHIKAGSLQTKYRVARDGSGWSNYVARIDRATRETTHLWRAVEGARQCLISTGLRGTNPLVGKFILRDAGGTDMWSLAGKVGWRCLLVRGGSGICGHLLVNTWESHSADAPRFSVHRHC